MSGVLARQEHIRPEFTRSAAVREKIVKKRPAPLSLRLSENERARLEAEADGVPLGAYIKSKVFDGRSGSGT